MALVAAHPVAGKETTGAAAADPELFAGRRVIITPSARSTPEAIELVEQLWLATGARVEQMPAAVHDQILARASHLPQLVSSALGAALAEERIAGRFAAAFGAGGLRDTTRLALSSPEMWRDICVTNREAILQALALFTASIENFPPPGGGRRRRRTGGRVARRTGGRAASRRRPAAHRGAAVRLWRSTDRWVRANPRWRASWRARSVSVISIPARCTARVALAAHRAGIRAGEPAIEQRLAPILRAIRIDFDGEQVLLDGHDVSGAITQTAISDLASKLSALRAVRARMVELQRAAGAGGGVVMEGRDIGTAVFPDAELKFYLDADVKVRAARRYEELRAKGEATTAGGSADATARSRPARFDPRNRSVEVRGGRNRDKLFQSLGRASRRAINTRNSQAGFGKAAGLESGMARLYGFV